MKWVVGSTSSGMHTYTKKVGGHIESDQPLRLLAVKHYHGDKEGIDYIKQVYTRRLLMPVPSQADCVNFMFMDIIERLDKTASFVHLKRDHKEIVDSLMEKGGEDQRIHPFGWEFKHNRKRELLEWYVITIDSIIAKHLSKTKASFEIINVKDIL